MVDYTILNGDNTFNINEIYTQNVEDETDNYYFTISVNETVFKIQSFKDLQKNKKVITDLFYYRDDSFECVLPVFKTEILTDMICLNQNKYVFYSSIKGTNSSLDKYVSNIEIYDENQFYNDPTILEKTTTLSLYNNLIDGLYFSFENYKGLYLGKTSSNNNLVNINLFSSDIYNKSAHLYLGKYYVTIDYSKQYDFTDIIVINITNGQKTTISYHSAISNNCYIQGEINGLVYLFDKNNKKQYEIDISKKTIIEIGNVNLETIYYDLGINVSKSAYEAAESDLIFNSYTVDNVLNDVEYDYVDKVGNQLSGFYFMYKKVGEKYQVYRANVQDSKYVTYLFEMTNHEKVIYDNDFIYYQNGEFINYFSDLTGVRTIASNSELLFNNSLIFGAYQK
ncbi:MAG: hypothetical protein ACK5HP_03895 [Bacilli bacterium]